MAYEPGRDALIFSQTNDKLITNTTVETSALGSGIGSKLIKSTEILPGRRLRLHGEGIYSAPLLFASLTARVKLGGTTVASVTTSSLGLNVTDKAFTFDCLLVFRSTGVSGKVVAGGSAQYTVSSGTKAFDDLDNAGSEITLNTTSDLSIDVTVQWDLATATRSLKTTIATIMLV